MGPPMVASLQVVIVTVGVKANTPEDDRQELTRVSVEYQDELVKAGIRVKLDDRDNTPGWKFNFWEMKGVSLRIELGPMDLKKGEFVMSKRNVPDPKAAKITGKDATLVGDVQKTLEAIHTELYSKALAERDARLASV